MREAKQNGASEQGSHAVAVSHAALAGPYKRSFVAEQAPVYHGCQVCAAFICFCVHREVADDCSAFRCFCFLRFSEVGSR